MARSRGVEQSETLGIVAPTMMRLKDAKIGFLGGCFRVLLAFLWGMAVSRGLR